MSQATPSTIKGRYTKLSTDRQPFLDAARAASKLTLPALFPPDGNRKHRKLTKKNPGIGARGVNNLASQLLLTLLPSTTPFLRLQVDTLELSTEGMDQMQTDIEKGLSKLERGVLREVNSSGDRVVLFEVLKHIIVGGNALLYVGKTGSRCIHLDRYVLRRDAYGNAVEMITHETVHYTTLPSDVLSEIESSQEFKDAKQKDGEVDIYTHIRRTESGWTWVQEVFGKKIPSTVGNAPEDACPWIPLRFVRVDGEDYGRSYVEEFIDDLNSWMVLNQAITEGSAAAAKVLILVDPSGSTGVDVIAKAPNGAVRAGNANDVTVLQMNKIGDFRTAYDLMIRIEDRLAQSFLLKSAIQRPGERVTAEEIRLMASELDDALGGMYAVQTQEFQLPYAKRRIALLKQAGKFPHLPKDLVKPTIVTGLEALGRGHDRAKLLAFVSQVGQLGGPEVIARYVNMGELIERLGTAEGIDTDGLIRGEEEIAAEQQQAMMMQMMQQLGPNAIGALGQMGSAAINNSGETPDGT
jgi:hypothetical protein